MALGNVARKTAEGTAEFLTKNLKKALSENIFFKTISNFSYFSLKKFKDRLDPENIPNNFFGFLGLYQKSWRHRWLGLFIFCRTLL